MSTFSKIKLTLKNNHNVIELWLSIKCKKIIFLDHLITLIEWQSFEIIVSFKADFIFRIISISDKVTRKNTHTHKITKSM